MRRVVPAALALAVLAVAGGLLLDRGDPAPRPTSGWTPVLVPRPDPSAQNQPTVEPVQPGLKGLLLPPATAPARIYPL